MGSVSLILRKCDSTRSKGDQSKSDELMRMVHDLDFNVEDISTTLGGKTSSKFNGVSP